MDAIDYIQRDHRNMFSVIYAFEYLAREMIVSDMKPDLQLFALILDYIGSFQDEYHHPKEDQYLFPAVLRHDASLKGVIDRLAQDHQAGHGMLDKLHRAFVRLAGDPHAEKVRFFDAVQEYAEFQRAHVSVEEQDVLKAARECVPAGEMDQITAAFADNADPMFGTNQARRFRDLFSRIVQIAPAPMGTGPAASAT